MGLSTVKSQSLDSPFSYELSCSTYRNRVVIKGRHPQHLSRLSSVNVMGVASHRCTLYSQLTHKLLQVYIHRLWLIKNLMTALYTYSRHIIFDKH